MGAPEGNQFWKLRSKHGRDKIFESPDHLWEAACEYFDWCEVNPLMESEQAKGTAKAVKDEETGETIFPPNLIEIPKMRAFTWEGLELFLDVSSFREYKTNPDYKDFSQVITRIEKVIYTQKFTGAAAGFLNPNIIARDLGLTDKIDSKNTNTNYNSEALTPEKIKEINKALEDEY
jgi:hypothetical protein